MTNATATYEISMTGENFGMIYAPSRDGRGLRPVGGIVVRPNANTVTLSRRLPARACRAGEGLGYTVPEHRETIKLPIASFDALALAHEILTEWAR